MRLMQYHYLAVFHIRREHESKLNALPHFKAKVPGDDAKLFDIHFVGVFSEKKEAMLPVFSET